MDKKMTQEQFEEMVQEHFAELPEAVQAAVTDGGVEKKLRALASKYKLHLDQWVLLENEIMLTLIGLEEPEDMVKNVAKGVDIDTELAQKLVNDIALQVFKPIRESMQGELNGAAMDRKTILVGGKNIGKSTAEKRAPTDTAAYKPGESSAERQDVQEDPYRESIE